MKKKKKPVLREIKLFFLTLIIWNADWTCIIHEENECYCNALFVRWQPLLPAHVWSKQTLAWTKRGDIGAGAPKPSMRCQAGTERGKKREGRKDPKAQSCISLSLSLFFSPPSSLSCVPILSRRFASVVPTPLTPPTPLRWVLPVCRCAESCHQALIDARIAENVFVCCPQLGKHPPKWKLIQNLISLRLIFSWSSGTRQIFFF